MNKQISYTSFITRIFTMILDSTFLGLISSLCAQCILRFLFLLSKVDGTNIEAFSKALTLKMQVFILLFQIMLFCFYVLGFWFYFSATPAQLLLRIRILDKDTLKQPEGSQFITRFFGLFLFPISIVFTLFTKKKQALHDLMSKTVVINQ